jgi:hypothetical protein
MLRVGQLQIVERRAADQGPRSRRPTVLAKGSLLPPDRLADAHQQNGGDE